MKVLSFFLEVGGIFTFFFLPMGHRILHCEHMAGSFREIFAEWSASAKHHGSNPICTGANKTGKCQVCPTKVKIVMKLKYCINRILYLWIHLAQTGSS